MKEIPIKISKNGTLALPKEIKDEFKGSTATLLPLNSGSFQVKKIPVGRPLVMKDVETILRKVNPDLMEKTEAKGEDLSFAEVASRTREVGKEITPKELEKEIRAVKNEELRRRNLL